jgi:hypothetical protein
VTASLGLANAGIFFTLMVAVGMVAVVVARAGAKGITTFVAGYYLLFAFGPVVNYLLGNEIYFGITLSAMPVATAGMCAALLAMCAAILIFPQRRSFDAIRLNVDDRNYPAVTVLHFVLSGYVIYQFISFGGALTGLGKGEKVAAAGPYHYDYLLIAMLASAFFFISMRTKLGRSLFWIHLATYIAYCLLTNERDFIFVFISLFLHFRLFREKASMWAPLLAGGGLLAVATYLFASRAGESTDIAQALNQGSLLFVDSYIVERYPDLLQFRWGETYLNAIASIAPSWLVTPTPSLADELVLSYAPGSGSGYGFSLTAEAYMNFGLAGVLVVFFGLAVAQQFLVNRCDHSLFWAYASIAFTIAWMYAIRGESLHLAKICFDAVLLYGVVSVTSSRPKVLLRISARFKRMSHGVSGGR